MAGQHTTVFDALIRCGIDNVALFMDETAAQRIVADIVDDMFLSCMDLTFKELDDHFKTYTDPTVVQGQIRLRPGIQKNIKAIVKWTRDELRLGRDFPLIGLAISFDATRRTRSS